MPDTVITVLTALGVGGLIGGWFTAGRERAEMFRQHMVEACVTFLQKTAEARSALEEVVAGHPAEARDRLTAAAAQVRALETQSLVLDLFFPQNPQRTVRRVSASISWQLRQRVRQMGRRLRQIGRQEARPMGVAGIPSRREQQHRVKMAGRYRSSIATSHVAHDVVRLYWEWHDALDQGLTGGVGPEELRKNTEEIKREADDTYNEHRRSTNLVTCVERLHY